MLLADFDRGATAAERRGIEAERDDVPRRNGKVAELYREYGPAVYRRCLRLLRDPEAARDATQEVFLRLLGQLAKLEARATVLPWIYRVATNHCLNRRRDAAAQRTEPVADEPLGAATACSDGAHLDRLLARAVMARFDAATQAIVVGVIVDGMEQTEVAEALGISRRTVARRLDQFREAAARYAGGELVGEG